MTDDSRVRILEACASVIASSGLAGFRMQQVANEAGVSIGLLSYHFGNRDGLLQAALDHVNESAAHRAMIAAPGPDPRERLAALLCSEFGEDTAIRQGSIAWNELRAAAVFSKPQAAALARSTASWQREVRALVSACLAGSDGGDSGRGGGTPETAESLALTLTALVEGLSGRWLTGQITAAAAQFTIREALARIVNCAGTLTSGKLGGVATAPVT